MAQDLLSLLHRLSRPVAPALGPLRGVARKAFRLVVGFRYRDEQLMKTRKNDRTFILSPELALRGELEEFETIEWFRTVTHPGGCAIDIGANLGLMTLELAELVGPAGKVISIEPSPGNVRLLRRHIDANGYTSRVEVLAAACTEVHGGSVRLFVLGDDVNAIGNGHSLLSNSIDHAQQSSVKATPQDVPAVSLDTVCAERKLQPTVLKVDVEGAELMVLRGAKQVLMSARPAVRVAFHPFAFDDVGRASDELRALFQQARYSFDGPASGPLTLREYVALPRMIVPGR